MKKKHNDGVEGLVLESDLRGQVSGKIMDNGFYIKILCLDN